MSLEERLTFRKVQRGRVVQRSRRVDSVVVEHEHYRPGREYSTVVCLGLGLSQVRGGIIKIRPRVVSSRVVSCRWQQQQQRTGIESPAHDVYLILWEYNNFTWETSTWAKKEKQGNGKRMWHMEVVDI